MRTFFLAAACAGVALGARHLRRFLSERRKSRLMARKIEVWESEGGAIPALAASPRDVN
jgi:hypothetical protein